MVRGCPFSLATLAHRLRRHAATLPFYLEKIFDYYVFVSVFWAAAVAEKGLIAVQFIGASSVTKYNQSIDVSTCLQHFIALKDAQKQLFQLDRLRNFQFSQVFFHTSTVQGAIGSVEIDERFDGRVVCRLFLLAFTYCRWDNPYCCKIFEGFRQ